jgi:hypothetical protein
MVASSLTRRLALGVAALSCAWAAYIIVLGGIDTRLFGVAIKSREPLRAFAVASVALLLYAAAGGVEATSRAWLARLTRINPRSVAAALAAATFAIGLAYSTTAGIGPDPYGYVSQAELWLHGRLTVPQPWARAVPWPGGERTFTPLGYTERNTDSMRGDAAIAPTYSPGLPLLMALFKKLGGHGALFAVVPLMGALLVLATYSIGASVGAPVAGLIAAWFIATSPAFLFMLMLPMSDVPAAACFAIATAFILSPTVAGSLAAGAACAVGILIRPNLWMLATLVGAWPIARAWRRSASAADVRRAVREAAAFAGAAAVGPLLVAATYARLYGSPFVSGYGSLDALFAASHIWPNLLRYPVWLAETHTPLAVAGLAALFVPARALWGRLADRRVLSVFALLTAAVWLQYLAYLVFDGWAFLRFLLPSWPFIMLGSATLVAAAVRYIGAKAPQRHATATVVAAWGVFMVGAWTMQTAADRGVFNEWRNDRRFVDLAQRIRSAIPDASVVYTMYQSGSIRYYAGRETFRFDALPPDWLDRSVEWFAQHGVHPYAAFADRLERDDFTRRFAGQHTLARLDDGLMMTYADEGTVYFWVYDLLEPASHAAIGAERKDLERLRSVPPAPPPTLTLVTPARSAP